MTKAGDVVIEKYNALYAVSVVLDDGDVHPKDAKVMGLPEAQEWAHNWTANAGGRVWLRGDDGQLTALP